MEASLLCRFMKGAHSRCFATYRFFSGVRPHLCAPGLASTAYSSAFLSPYLSHGAKRWVSVGRPIGQPTHETHPHLIGPGELTKWIKKEEFKLRRDRLVSTMMPGSVALFYSAPEKIMTADIPYENHHSTSVSYLSGFQETNAILVLEKTGAANTHNFYMLVRERDPKRELWDGPSAGTEVMVPLFGCDKVFNISKAKEVLDPILSQASKIYCNPKTWPDMYKDLQLEDKYRNKTEQDKILDELKLVKSPAELALMQQASTITGESFAEAMAFTRPGMLESVIHAKIEFESKLRGAQKLAYPPVVAAGANGLSLHYVANTDLLKDGDLVLVDAGCEYHGYVSDITRTWPVGKRFSQAQREVYEVVLDCNKKCIQSAVAGTSLRDLQVKASGLLHEGLVRLGVLKPFEKGFDVMYPHMIGHYVGMDVHDCDSMTTGTTLKAGMTITIEPGLYIPKIPSVPERFRGIAIRVEDIVQITEGRPIVLTKSAPKEISEIEALRNYK
eukprot:Phypoly_transcript_07430.p1 GENE.Phypoly_transcript_07430~~Phypoly_transcript_07430.p1  ORF type:complete len:501 (+),score=59.73 Phypoly_transcript_07430:75-1577(+)